MVLQMARRTFPIDCADSDDVDGGGRSYDRSFSPQSSASLLFKSRVRVTVSIRFRDRFLSLPKQDLQPSTALVPLIKSLDRLGVDRVGLSCE
jgi:hypothetical protein